MSRESERAAITAHFNSWWVANYPSYPIAWPNQEFDTPRNSLFAVVNLVDRGTARESIGSRYVKRHRGTLQVDIYVPSGQGLRPGRLVGDAVESRYDSLNLPLGDGRVAFFRTPSARDVGGNESRASNLEDNWARYIVDCPYDVQSVVGS